MERSGRIELIDAAERLIAEQGPAVSLRQIVVAAGQRNSAAIRYHFGSREDLIAAVIAQRQAVFEPRRLVLLDEAEAAGEVTVAGLVRVLVEPAFEHQRREGPGHHARFMEKVRDLPEVVFTERADWPATSLLMRRLAALTGVQGVSPTARAVRVRGLASVVLALLADLEREPAAGPQQRAEAEDAVVEMIVGCLGR
ncbi:TetR family transcriptional regulator [Nocardioides sp.]|uniref:TetR/AcrR family transcriptional regulator n=1 Tax=Nocardioides sp. TaxID=35761 RepID=UPI003517F22D